MDKERTNGVNLCEGHVYLDAKVNGKLVHILIDTGSSANLISEHLIKELQLSHLLTQSSFRLVGVTGAPLQTMGVLKEVPVSVQQINLNANFIVTSNMSEECILGQEFLEQHQMVLDFNNKTLTNNHISTKLKERVTKKRNLFIKTVQDALIMGSTTRVVNCKLYDDNGEEVIHTGIYYIQPNRDLWPEEESPGSDHNTKIPVQVESGNVEIAIANEAVDTELWLPEDTLLANATPAIYSSNVVDGIKQS